MLSTILQHRFSFKKKSNLEKEQIDYNKLVENFKSKLKTNEISSL